MATDVDDAAFAELQKEVEETEGIELHRVAPQSVLNNYFSVGSDADTALRVCTASIVCFGKHGAVAKALYII